MEPLLLFGAWLLLANPDAHNPNAPLSAWKKVSDYDTPYLCEEGRRKKALKTDKKKQHSPGPLDLLGYRCVREEQYRAVKQR